MLKNLHEICEIFGLEESETETICELTGWAYLARLSTYIGLPVFLTYPLRLRESVMVATPRERRGSMAATLNKYHSLLLQAG